MAGSDHVRHIVDGVLVICSLLCMAVSLACLSALSNMNPEGYVSNDRFNEYRENHLSQPHPSAVPLEELRRLEQRIDELERGIVSE